jgi:hypothetical protein
MDREVSSDQEFDHQGFDPQKELAAAIQGGRSRDRNYYAEKLRLGEIKPEDIIALAAELSLFISEMKYRAYVLHDKSLEESFPGELEHYNKRSDNPLMDPSPQMHFIHEFANGNLLGVFLGGAGPENDPELSAKYGKEFYHQSLEDYNKLKDDGFIAISVALVKENLLALENPTASQIFMAHRNIEKDLARYFKYEYHGKHLSSLAKRIYEELGQAYDVKI